jgi:hypothetical protein
LLRVLPPLVLQGGGGWPLATCSGILILDFKLTKELCFANLVSYDSFLCMIPNILIALCEGHKDWETGDRDLEVPHQVLSQNVHSSEQSASAP